MAKHVLTAIEKAIKRLSEDIKKTSDPDRVGALCKLINSYRKLIEADSGKGKKEKMTEKDKALYGTPGYYESLLPKEED